MFCVSDRKKIKANTSATPQLSSRQTYGIDFKIVHCSFKINVFSSYSDLKARVTYIRTRLRFFCRYTYGINLKRAI